MWKKTFRVDSSRPRKTEAQISFTRVSSEFLATFMAEPVPSTIFLSTVGTDDWFSVGCFSNFFPSFVEGFPHFFRSCQECLLYLFSHICKHLAIWHGNIGFYAFCCFYAAEGTEIRVFRDFFATIRTKNHTCHPCTKRERIT